jgi:hypothetical protein
MTTRTFGKGFDDAFRCLQAIQIGHGNIHEDYVRVGGLDQFDGLAAVAGLADHFDSGEFLKRVANTGPDDGVIVGQDDTNLVWGTSVSYQELGVRHFSGNQAWTSVPCPGVDLSSRRPSTSVARSSMLSRPRLAP